MENQTELHETTNQNLDEDIAESAEWAKSIGVEDEILLTQRMSATGTFDFGGAIGAVLLVDLTFNNGQKFKFNGKCVGEIVGGAGGVCYYNGAIPTVNDKWNYWVTGVAGAAGVFKVTFNPVWGPHGSLGAAAAGLGIAKGGGQGIWTAG